ncbi:V-type ATPase subunit [Alkalibacter rhizosphaerae]|uniref:V-type ATPase subunit n=1 Tax=Alkalibacter rhizosphaerae TaxID=2815577 RepID=A0A974XLU7_9FIRM|nr:V-type ATPase subunit [Alkalibacter rhizosphaerae]QSX08326.1 V-type ATPase subunit [Alkalibacter rhizosphaerae]
MLINNQTDAIFAKTSGMKANLLDDEDFNQLIRRDTVREIYDYLLENSNYGEALAKLKGQKIHRGDVELALYKTNIQSNLKLLHYLGGEYKVFLKTFLRKYEIEDVKLAIESVTGRTRITDLENHILSDEAFSDLDMEALFKRDTLEQVMEQLKGTDYYRLLEPYANQVDSKFSFYVEMILDRYYFSNLLKAMKKLPDKDAGEARELMQRNVDLYNLEWIYRARKFYDISKEEVLNFTLDGGKKFPYRELESLIYDHTFEGMIEVLQKSEYGFMFNHDHDVNLYMERRIERYMYYKSKSLYRRSILDFGKVVAFILLHEYEVKDITSIIECKRYKLSSSEIAKYLIRNTEVTE